MSIFSMHKPPSQFCTQAAKERLVSRRRKSTDMKLWGHLIGKWIAVPAVAAATTFGALAVGVTTATPASAKMNQAATAFYDAVPGVIVKNLPVYRGMYTIQPVGKGTHITKLHWENTHTSNICAQKTDFEAFAADGRRLWESRGNPVYGCKHGYTGNRAVDLSSAGAVKVCGTLFFLRQTGRVDDWYPKVQSCAIM